MRAGEPPSRRYAIDLAGERPVGATAARRLRRLARAVLAAEGVAPCRLSLALVLPETSRRLNRSYRGRDRAANVLSFPGTGQPPTPRARLPELGELVVCPAAAVAETEGTAVRPEERLGHLVIHGILHLVGYDHEEVPPEEVARMERREEELRRRLHALYAAPSLARLCRDYAVNADRG